MSAQPIDDDTQPVIDVSALPRMAFGSRDPMWWGLALLIAIESTMFALLVVTYFYLRGGESTWPPPGALQPPLALSIGTIVAMLISAIPTYVAYRAARHGRLRPMQLGMIVATIFGLIASALRGFEFATFRFLWNSHAYGSIVWTIYGMHSFHLFSGTLEDIVMTALLLIGPVEEKHLVDVRLGAAYWWFVVFAWLPLWAILVIDGVTR